MTERFDFLVVGGGIGGVSAGYELARLGRVCVLEREDQLAFHSTGRSAAMLLESYGNRPVRALTTASRAFYEAPPDGFGDAPLATPRGALYLADEERLPDLARELEAVRALVPSVRRVEEGELAGIVPCLAPGRWRAGLHEPLALDLDVHAILQGYARGLRARGGAVVTGEEVRTIARGPEGWTVESTRGTRSARVLVNAAGAWADVVAGLAGAPPVGLRPLRRTAILVDGPGDFSRWPLVIGLDESFYFKPEARRLLVSPADETPSAPCNAVAEAMDVALAVDRLERATTIRVSHVSHRWAGLRSFVADRTPVAGPDPACEGLVWLAAQGGYGVQTAPALARTCAALVAGEPLPADVAALGLLPEDLDPRRPALRAA